MGAPHISARPRAMKVVRLDDYRREAPTESALDEALALWRAAKDDPSIDNMDRAVVAWRRWEREMGRLTK